FNKDLYFLDFSPAYLSNSQAISRLARAAGDHDVKVILHLREPVSQAYAHYLHDLKAHVTSIDDPRNDSYSFFSRQSLHKYLRLRAPLIETLLRAIGRHNIFVVNFHRDLRDRVGLQTRLASFLGVSDFAL